MIDYTRYTPEVAQQLIGCIITSTTSAGERRSVRLTETEAYLAENDLACHAATKRTKRNDVMFSQGGVLYVYLIYGMYYCANIVTETTGRGCAVLLRGGELIDDVVSPPDAAKGPGKLARYMGWDLTYNATVIGGGVIDIRIDDQTEFYRSHIVITPRIGITKDADHMLRYYASNSRIVSGKKYRNLLERPAKAQAKG